MKRLHEALVDGADAALAHWRELSRWFLFAQLPSGPATILFIAPGLLETAHAIGELGSRGFDFFLAHVRAQLWQVHIDAELVEHRGYARPDLVDVLLHRLRVGDAVQSLEQCL